MRKFWVGQRVVLIKRNIWIKKYAIGKIIEKNLIFQKNKVIVSFNYKDFKSLCISNGKLICYYIDIKPLNQLTKYQLVQVMKRKLTS